MKSTILTCLFYLLCHGIAAQDCTEFEPSGEDCESAPFICDLDNYCTRNDAAGNGTPADFCGIVENDVWFAFTAGSTVLELEVNMFDCNTPAGMQGIIFDASNCDNTVAVSNCVDGGTGSFVLLAENLIIGENYHIMLDGKGGNVCTFFFNLLQGMTATPEWADAGENTSICPGDALVLNGTSTNNAAATTFTWETDDGSIISGQNTLNPTVDAPGMYVLSVIDAVQNCTATDTVAVMLNDGFFLTVPQPAQIDCEDNQSVDLTATVNSNDAWTFIWTNADGETVGEEAVVPVTLPGEYTVTAVDADGNCGLTETVTVTSIIDFPIALIDAPEELNCVNESVIIDATGSALQDDYTIDWTFTPTGQTTAFPLAADLIFTTSETGIYELTVANPDNGCVSVAQVTVSENPARPEIIHTTVLDVCADETVGVLRIDSITGGNPEFLYALDDSVFTATMRYENLAPGDYFLQVRDAVGCTLDTLLTVEEIPEIIVDLGDDLDLFLGDSVTLRPLTSVNNLNYTWTTSADSLACTDCENPALLPFESAYYFLEVNDENGCTAFDTLYINVDKRRKIYVANAFSPDNDGINDLLFLQSGNDVLRVERFEIYNRWGNLVFTQTDFLPNDAGEGFDGRFRGNILEQDVYAWVAEVIFIDGVTEFFTGDVLLVR